VNSTLSARVFDTGGYWSAELRLDLAWLRQVGWGDVAGIDLGHYWVNSQGNDYHWPYAAQYNRPYTWAEAGFRRTPHLTSIAPYTATVPTAPSLYQLVTTGDSFVVGDSILWDGSPLTTYYVSSSQLYAYLGNANLTAGEHQVRVLSAGSNGVTTAPKIFTVYNPTPLIGRLSPTTAAAGSGNFFLYVYGSGFLSGATVYFDGSPLPTTFVNSGLLRVTLTSAQTAQSGPQPVSVANPEPVQSVSNGATFNVWPPPVAVLVEPELDGADVDLWWAEVPGNQSYPVHRSTTEPYFIPGPGSLITTVYPPAHNALQQNVLAFDHLFYLVQSTYASEPPADSNRVGVFNIPITPGVR